MENVFESSLTKFAKGTQSPIKGNKRVHMQKLYIEIEKKVKREIKDECFQISGGTFAEAGQQTCCI